jgi:hypothetical protein
LLRSAIQAANAKPNADTIIVPAGTYNLTITGNIANSGSGGTGGAGGTATAGSGAPVGGLNGIVTQNLNPGATGRQGTGIGGGLNLTSGGTPKITNTNVTRNTASTTEDNIHGIIVT